MSTSTPFLGCLVLVTDNEIVRVLCHFEYYTQRAEYNLQARRSFLERLPNFLVNKATHPAPLRTLRSRNQVVDHVAVNVGEAIVTPRIAVGELLVIEAHEVENRRVHVVDMDAVLDR